MFLLLLRKTRNSLGICYRAGLRAQVSITKLMKNTNTHKIIQIFKKRILNIQYKRNSSKKIIKLITATISTLMIISSESDTDKRRTCFQEVMSFLKM